MTRPPTSIAARAAWAAFVSAALTAALSAIAASTLAELFVLRRTDEQVLAVAAELARQIRVAPPTKPTAMVVRDEQLETTSTGIRLALYGAGNRIVAGDDNVPIIASDSCATVDALRICRAPAEEGMHVVAGTHRPTSQGPVAIAALVAAFLSGWVAWAFARLLSRRAVEPLVRLQTRIARLALDGRSRLTKPFGSDDGVSEVDALRSTLETLLAGMHEAIDRSTSFAANAAHELRTPLTALRAELELMAEASPEPALVVALRKVAQLQALTERLLVLATPDRGDEGFAVVSLRDVVEDVVSELPTKDAARVSIVGDGDAVVRGDAETLAIAVSNGISNGLKFGQRISIEVGRVDDRALVAIEDDGPGVPESERMAVFEPFARGGAAQRIPGHGLGLALVAEVAKRHHGSARLTESRSCGARLEIALPPAP